MLTVSKGKLKATLKVTLQLFKTWGGSRAQLLRAVSALAEDLARFQAPSRPQVKTNYNNSQCVTPVQGISRPLLTPRGKRQACGTRTYTHTPKINKSHLKTLIYLYIHVAMFVWRHICATACLWRSKENCRSWFSLSPCGS